MKNYSFTVGIITIVAGILAFLCLLTGLLAVEFNFEAFSNPILALNYGHNAHLAKWFMILDMLGYYLLLLPIIFFLHQQYKYRSPWTPLFTFSGLAYVIIGAMGAAILAVIWPEFMTTYNASDVDQQAVIAMHFTTMNMAVIQGLWNILEVLLAGVWWMGMGILLYADKKWLSVLSVIAGFATLTDGIANIVSLPFIAEIGLNLYLLLGILWPVCIGVHIIQKSRLQSSFRFDHHKETVTS